MVIENEIDPAEALEVSDAKFGDGTAAQHKEKEDLELADERK
jgi:hypothetical protein